MYRQVAFLLLLSYSVPLVLAEDNDNSISVDVISLKNIQINNYNGPLDGEMMKLFKNVEVLELRQCNFTPFHDNVLHSLPNLRKLYLSNSNILREEHDIESCCKNLKEIVLINSGLISLPWHQIGDSWPVEKVFLSRENSRELKANILADKKMKFFTLEYSGVEVIDDGVFNGVKNLETLSLEGNKIKKITKEILAPLKTLKELNLRKNLLEELTADQIPNLPSLEKLDIGYNPIKKIDLVAIKRLLPKLTVLDVSGIENIDIPKGVNLGDLNLVKNEIL